MPRFDTDSRALDHAHHQAVHYAGAARLAQVGLACQEIVLVLRQVARRQKAPVKI